MIIVCETALSLDQTVIFADANLLSIGTTQCTLLPLHRRAVCEMLNGVIKFAYTLYLLLCKIKLNLDSFICQIACQQYILIYP